MRAPLPTTAATTRRPLLRLLLAAQVLYVLGVAGAGYATTTLGRRVTLAAAPINPRELQSGDFVRLSYGISQVPRGTWRAAVPPKRRQSIYILLNTKPNSPATVAGVYAEAPQAAAGQAVLRGWVGRVYARSLTLRFGLERYNVPSDSPLRRERPGRLHPLLVEVSVAPWGQASIVGVEVVR